RKMVLPHLKLVIVGAQWAARSSAGNIILGKHAFDVNENGNRRTTCCEINHGVFQDKRLTVVDSPGWFYNHTLQDTNEMDKLEIEKIIVSMCSPGPHVFLLLVPILRSFTEKDLKALVEIMKPLTERVWRHCMVVFTYGDWLEGLPVENYIVKEGKKLQELLEKCGNRYHVLNRCHFYDPVQVKELLQKIFDMVKQNREYFTIKGKQTMFQKQPLSEKEHTFTEEEWIRREQELIERVMRALAKEPEEPTAPSMKVANSKND
uniref:AIG1-type G domain-containing protein n=1 Tax=Poecilia formosa TaxID=48698 RepID=A0A096LU36_POEFO